MKQESEYKGYRIICRHIGKWFAQIFSPGSKTPLPDVPVVTSEKGYERLLQIVHRLIDKKEDGNKRGA
jgi:hypothetical protein